jgi:tetratricopeptide (TPR) repeat protein/uncharacterized protein YegL
MNDDTDKPLNPVGDAALEARITAWVLGEASPFEAAELEEICARDPEARLFERRLRVLHGFITADRKAGSEDEWKLPAEKRSKIEALFEEPVVEKVEIREHPKVVHRGQTGRRALLALAACTVVSVATWSLLGTIGVSSKKSEVAAMRMKAPQPSVEFVAGGSGGGGGFGGGVGAPADSLSFDAPATPAVPARPMGGPMPAPAAQPAPALDGLAAVESKSERGQVMDESLMQLAEESDARRSKSSAAGPPVKKPSTSYMHLGQNSPFTSKPALRAEDGVGVPIPESATAAIAAEAPADAVALNDFADQAAYGFNLSGDRNGESANHYADVDADGSDRFAYSLRAGSQRDSRYDLQARFRGEAPEVEAKPAFKGWLSSDVDSAAPASGPVAAGGAMAPGNSFGSAVAPPQQGGRAGSGRIRNNNDFIGEATNGVVQGMPADPGSDVTDIVTAGNRSGLGEISRNSIDAILNNPDRGGRVQGTIPPPTSAPATPPPLVGAWSSWDKAPAEPAGALADASKEGTKGDGTIQMNGSVSTGSAFFDVEGAGKKELAQQEFKSSATGKDTWFGRTTADEQLELPDASVAKNRQGGAGGAVVQDSEDFGNTNGPMGETAAGDYSGLAQKEMIRRQNAVAASDKLRDEGRDAYAKGDFKVAVDKYKESLDVLPEAPMVQDRRDYLSQVLADGSTALGEEYRRVGKYAEARQLADDALALDAKNAQAKTLQNYLDDPIRTNPALTFQNTENTEEVRRKLYVAEGNYNLGKFDDAHRTYEDVLRIDPFNKAARRGMESVAQARSDYYRAAYDQTRAQLLAQVDRAWELPADQEAAKKKQEEAETNLTSLAETANPSELLPRLEKAIREQEEKLQSDPNSPEIQAHLSALSKIGEDIRTQINEDTRGGKVVQEQDNAPVPVPMAETQTSAEPFSTFSLHVSDASFKMAKAALERGEVPAAESIRPEEFYNAFDFGDPSPANGEPVVCAVEQCAHPALPQRNLLRIGVETGSQGRGGSTPLNLTLLLDSSGSMEREDRNAGLANAVQQLSSLLKEGDTVSVIGFARQPRLLVDRLPGNRAQELNAIFAQTPSEGGTNLEEGIKLGEELALRQFNPAAQNRIVLFTDGAANLGDAKPETLQAKVEQMRQKGIAFDAAGFGTDGLNDKLLERLTRNGNGRYYIVDRAEDADENFAKQLAGAFRPAAENVKVQVRFNPARVAKYKLIGFEEHRLKKEDFRNDGVDAAEMAAEEAGNALYQIEALPQGEGEVGEVSVRFRDTASGQMVERTWTIPYESQAPAFDQAAPAIQLAGLAAFAAEKLRAAPMADAVDFQQLAPVMAKVKARYASSKPVAELEAMIGKLK